MPLLNQKYNNYHFPTSIINISNSYYLNFQLVLLEFQPLLLEFSTYIRHIILEIDLKVNIFC